MSKFNVTLCLAALAAWIPQSMPGQEAAGSTWKGTLKGGGVCKITT